MLYHFRKNKFSTILFIFLAFSACDALAYICNQELGNKNISNGNYDLAFEQLKGCENIKSVTGLTLGQLAVLYGDFGYGDFANKADRIKKIYDLYLRSAMKGNEDAVQSLISIFETGEASILLSPNQQKVKCLSRLVPTKKGYNVDEVSLCLE